MMTEMKRRSPDISVVLEKIAIRNALSMITGIFSLLKNPILPLGWARFLVRCGSFANHRQSFMGRALNLRQSRFVNNLGIDKGDGMKKMTLLFLVCLLTLQCGYHLRGTGSSLPPHIKVLNVPMFANRSRISPDSGLPISKSFAAPIPGLKCLLNITPSVGGSA